MTPRTLLLGLDGATFRVLDPLMAAGEMPFLASFIAEGVRAGLRSTVPALTPPAWTSMLTGRSPGAHGIFDFFRKEGSESHRIRFLTSRDIETELIFDVAGRAGRTSTVLNFPLTFPAPAIEGHVVPGGWMPWKQLRLGCRPAGLYDRLKQIPGFDPRKVAMDMSHEEKALEGCERDEYEGWVQLHIEREVQWFNILAMLLEEEPADLVAILFDGVDKIQHLCWRFIDPEMVETLTEPWERRVREVCLDYFRRLDGLMADLVARMGNESSVVIVSDHGFGPQVRTFFANAWLAGQGHLKWSEGEVATRSDEKTLGVGDIARHVYQMDWSETRAYAPMPSGNGIHIVRQDESHPHGVSEAEYESFRDALAAALLEVRDPESGEPVVARVWKREEIFAGPQLQVAPDLTLELTDGGLISILNSEAPVVPRPEPAGTHAPLGIFLARGPDLRAGVTIDDLDIVDVPPLLLYGVDVAIPAAFEGTFPSGAVEPAALAARPPRIQETDGEASKDGDPETDEAYAFAPEAEEEMMKRLRALGYVE